MEENKVEEVPKPPAEKPVAPKEATKPPPKPTTATNEKKRKAVGPAANVNPKSKKVKRKREDGAPKLPLTGYVRYMNERRDALRNELPDKTAIEHTKIIADEWNRMSEDQKKPYLQAAEIDKERYNQQLDEFHKQKIEQKKSESLKENVPSPANASNGAKSTTNNEKTQMNGKEALVQPPKPLRRSGEMGIPIFTDEFLDHNKTVDMELKTLRKSNIDLEQQNSVLEKHIENMKFGVEKIEAENNELLLKNKLLEAYLEKFEAKLAQAFCGLAIPSQPNGATVDNIDKYMTDLYNMATSNSHGPASLNKAKDIIRKLDLQIQL